MIRRDNRVQTSPGGIILADTPDSWPWTGEVLEVGSRVEDPDVTPGTRVLFEPKGGSALIPDTREGGPREWERVVQVPLGNILGVVDAE